MKLFHLSDLHLGKRVNGFSMLDDQAYILNEILTLLDAERPDGVLIAGDVYDKAVPPAEAVMLFDRFLCKLSERKLQVFVISGNHDSPERMAFGGQLMTQSGVHLAPVYDGTLAPISLNDANGVVNVYLLPFLKPVHVRRFFPEAEITSYSDALRLALSEIVWNPLERNVLVTHQFVTGAVTAESEELSVGGTENVDASVFAGFDYVALGHIHRPQSCGAPHIRYCGTPLKYSFSEATDEKSITVLELHEKGNVLVRTLPLFPRRELRELRGQYDALVLKSYYADTTYPEDYVHIILTDEEDIPGVVEKLRVIYPYLMKLSYDNKRTQHNASITMDEHAAEKSPLALFSELYELQNNQPMSETQAAFLQTLLARVWEEGA